MHAIALEKFGGLGSLVADAPAGRLDVKPARIFRFDEIREADRVMEANEMVVVRD